MPIASSLPPTFVPPGAGPILHAFGETVIMHLDSAATGGALNLWTEITPPGGGPPAHYHEREDECFVVQEGRVAFLSGGEWHEVGPGAIVFMPRKHIHAFKNVRETPSRMLLSTTPGGFDKFFARCDEEFKTAAAPDMERILRISAEHGIHFVNT
ncbi:MAG: cupin domain-containing protein [Verrucomicrobiota bacterium]|jgi:mannose-6-phosphate isomerase-like protein (cupin superfamily)|nr:cupin domain-containing protein [Chthoniobacterales bacterium]MBA3762243.1 cupin domain-containing protein [Chthoniobacterales bacterium]MDQ3315012.1 cupin domain-containing protein [Verrucomicrobiota bacterium]